MPTDFIRARYQLKRITQRIEHGRELTEVLLCPIRHDAFFQTPNGENPDFPLQTSNPVTAQFLKDTPLGEEVYVTLTRVIPQSVGPDLDTPPIGLGRISTTARPRSGITEDMSQVVN